MSVVKQLGIRIRQLFNCSFSSLRWVEVHGVNMIDFLINRSFRSGQHRRADCLAPLSVRLCLAQVHISDNTGRFWSYDPE